MHFLKITGLMSLALWTANALTNPACAGQSVVFVTVTAPEVTKTVVVSVPYGKENAAAAVETALAVSHTSILTDITTTLTSYVTSTEFFTVAPAPPTPKGPYYFSEHDGTLEWLNGKTPPATGSFLTITTFITVQPVPSNFPALVEETSVATTYSTVSLYRDSTIYRTKVITSTVRVPAIPVKSFVNPGSAGWNTSYSPKGGKYQILSGKPKPTVWQTGAAHVTGHLEARQVGAVVVATINGAVVSWINSYDGKPTSTPPSPSVASCIGSPASLSADQLAFSTAITKSVSTFSAVTTRSVQPTPVEGSSLSALKEPANLAIYPWDPSPPLRGTTASGLGNILSKQALKTAIRSRFPIRSVSTLSTVTTKSVTSVFSFTSIRPTPPVKGPDFSDTSNNPSFCDGKIGGKPEFVLTFDDLPTFSTGPDSTDVPPIFNPYRKLYFEEHFGYVPPPSVAFLPHSPPQLAVYRVGDGLNVNGSPGAGLELVGEFGSGPRALYSAFWIDAFSFWIGCENDGPSDCKITVNGYALTSVIRTVYQDITIPPCGESRGCKLTYVELGENFRNLTGVQILAAVDRQLTDFYIDDISLGWSNNTCAAQRQRASVR